MLFWQADALGAAATAMEQQHWVEAQVLLQRVSAGTGPQSSRALAMLARVHFQMKQPQQAEAAARAAASRGVGDPQTWHLLALHFAQSGRRADAALWERKFALSKQADAAAPLRAAYLNFEVGRFAETVALLGMVNKQEGNPEWLLLLAASHAALKHQTEAIAAHREYLQRMPYSEPAHAEMAQTLLRFGRFQEAVAFLEEAVGKFDKSPQLVLSLGVAYYGQRRFPDAGRQFFRVIELDPTVAQPYEFLAKILDQLPDELPRFRKAAESWRKSGTPGPTPHYVLARVLEDAGEDSAVVAGLLRQALALDPKHANSWFALGALEEKERKYAEAAAAFEENAALEPTRAETQFRLARLYDRLQQPAKAAAKRALHRKLTQPDGKGVGKSTGMADLQPLEGKP